jgi:hypothetical protein
VTAEALRSEHFIIIVGAFYKYVATVAEITSFDVIVSIFAPPPQNVILFFMLPTYTPNFELQLFCLCYFAVAEHQRSLIGCCKVLECWASAHTRCLTHKFVVRLSIQSEIVDVAWLQDTHCRWCVSSLVPGGSCKLLVRCNFFLKNLFLCCLSYYYCG